MRFRSVSLRHSGALFKTKRLLRVQPQILSEPVTADGHRRFERQEFAFNLLAVQLHWRIVEKVLGPARVQHTARGTRRTRRSGNT